MFGEKIIDKQLLSNRISMSSSGSAVRAVDFNLAYWCSRCGQAIFYSIEHDQKDCDLGVIVFVTEA
jgi:hypothetical protein